MLFPSVWGKSEAEKTASCCDTLMILALLLAVLGKNILVVMVADSEMCLSFWRI